MSDTRRAAIEAAFEAAETPIDETPPTDAPVVDEAPPTDAPVVDEAPPTDAPVDASGDKPPQSWKSTERVNWSKVDPVTKSAIQRRELEITRTLSDTASARRLAQDFGQVMQPFMARIQSMNAHPLHAVQELMKADHILSTAPKAQRAAMVAKIIADYDVDIEALDEVLSGRAKQEPTPPPPNMTAADVERLVAARLSEGETQRQLDVTMAMFEDSVKFPHFQSVRQDMADLIELSVKKGKPITLEAAYNKAVQLDPVISAELATKDKATKAAAANAAAQRAKKASLQVGGAPSGNFAASPANTTSRRDAISAAFEAHSGR